MATRSDPDAIPENLRSEPRESLLPVTNGIAGDLRKWPIFHCLPLELAKTIRLCCIFGSNGASAHLVTHDDKVFAIGADSQGRLGNGFSSCLDPLEIKELSGKAVQSFAYGRRHVLALTKKGEVYGWGENSYSSVGRYDTGMISSPALVYNGEDPALEIACGSYHSVCRTSKGAVYCWGTNDYGQLGNGNREKQPAPRKVEHLIADLRCTGISCQNQTTVAVFEHGEVFLWGELYDASRRTSEYQTTPVRVHLGNGVIRKVACGYDHTLALDDTGLLYVWGYNGEGQLGLSHTSNKSELIPHLQLESMHGRVLEIAASGAISAVMTENSKVLMWGRGTKVPTEVLCESVQDVFATFTPEPKTPVPLVVTSMSAACSKESPVPRESCPNSGWDGNLANTVAELFDNPEFSDVQFLVQSKTIYAHKLLLKLQSEYFRKKFQSAEGDNNGDRVEVTGYNYPVYKAFVRYFYTGEVDLPFPEIIELLDLANSCSEKALKTICQRRIENLISIENCVRVYLAALRCGAKDLEETSFRFAEEHLTAVTQTSAFTEMPDDVFKRFFAEMVKKGAFKS